MNRVRVDDLFVVFPLLVRVGSFVDQLHLLEDSRLSGLSGSEQEHFARFVNDASDSRSRRRTARRGIKDSHLIPTQSEDARDTVRGQGSERVSAELGGISRTSFLGARWEIARGYRRGHGTYRMFILSFLSWFSIASLRVLLSTSSCLELPQPMSA